MIAVPSPLRSAELPGGAEVAPTCLIRLIGVPPASVPEKFASNPTALESPGAATAAGARAMGMAVDDATTTRTDHARNHLAPFTGRDYLR